MKSPPSYNIVDEGICADEFDVVFQLPDVAGTVVAHEKFDNFSRNRKGQRHILRFLLEE